MGLARLRYNQEFEMSATALHDTLSAAGARLAEYSGAQTAAVFSSPQEEFAALRSGCGLFDLGWRAKILLTGPDRVKWMNGMVTNNVRDLPPGRGVYSFLLNPQGHILADMNVYNRNEYLLVDTDMAQAARVLATFEHYIIMDDVEVKDSSEKLTAIGLEGPRSGVVLRAAGFPVPELEPMQIEDASWQDTGISLVRTRTGGYQVWLNPANSGRAWEALVAAGATPVGTDALEMWRVAAGVPKYEQDIRERDLPQETGQEHALNFTKGCYVGQEIVERIRSRGAVHRAFTGFVFDSRLPAAGSKIQKDGRDIGEVTSVAIVPAPAGERALGLGYIRREAGAAGARVDVQGVPATLSDLPFNL